MSPIRSTASTTARSGRAPADARSSNLPSGDVGFPLAPGAVTYWVGEAMRGTDYQDLDETPEAVASTTKALAANAVHLARRLTGSPYPAA